MNKKYSLIFIALIVLIATFFIFGAKKIDGNLSATKSPISDTASSTVKE